jgi:hypothetical protein
VFNGGLHEDQAAYVHIHSSGIITPSSIHLP